MFGDFCLTLLGGMGGEGIDGETTPALGPLPPEKPEGRRTMRSSDFKIPD